MPAGPNQPEYYTIQCVIKLHNVYFQDPHKKQEDVHSDLSNDTGTFDSGMGGSVSDTGTVLCNICPFSVYNLNPHEKIK